MATSLPLTHMYMDFNLILIVAELDGQIYTNFSKELSSKNKN
jgi:hypothetical protein